eukprot:361616-Chlamydomonas_euryale.AAC.17
MIACRPGPWPLVQVAPCLPVLARTQDHLAHGAPQSLRLHLHTPLHCASQGRANSMHGAGTAPIRQCSVMPPFPRCVVATSSVHPGAVLQGGVNPLEGGCPPPI